MTCIKCLQKDGNLNSKQEHIEQQQETIEQLRKEIDLLEKDGASAYKMLVIHFKIMKELGCSEGYLYKNTLATIEKLK